MARIPALVDQELYTDILAHDSPKKLLPAVRSGSTGGRPTGSTLRLATKASASYLAHHDKDQDSHNKDVRNEDARDGIERRVTFASPVVAGDLPSCAQPGAPASLAPTPTQPLYPAAKAQYQRVDEAESGGAAQEGAAHGRSAGRALGSRCVKCRFVAGRRPSCTHKMASHVLIIFVYTLDRACSTYDASVRAGGGGGAGPLPLSTARLDPVALLQERKKVRRLPCISHTPQAFMAFGDAADTPYSPHTWVPKQPMTFHCPSSLTCPMAPPC